MISVPCLIPADTGGAHLQIRRSIASLFPNRDCFTLVRPVNDEKQLQNLDGALARPMIPVIRC